MYDANVAQLLFSKVPGKCIRGRWLAVESIERIVSKAAAQIGKVFSNLWPGHIDESLYEDGDEEAAAHEAGAGDVAEPDPKAKAQGNVKDENK